ncbi:MAG: TonB C-terminal domain-containing protein [Thermodesulfobacteriota bacterium]|nr:TonB C-terminal domain-containing protein [Thermodesulfobacteriota bacterium]
MKKEPRALFFTFVVSTILHLIFLAALIFVPGPKPYKHFSPSVINVSMVALPGQKKMPGTGRLAGFEIEKEIAKPEKAPVSRISPERVAKSDRNSSKVISVSPKKKRIKKSLKKQTFKSSRVVKSIISRIEKKVEKSRPNPVAEAIDRLKNKVATGRKQPQSGTGATSSSTGVHGGSGGGGKKALELMDIYRAQISYYIEKSWAFSKQLAGGRTDLAAVVVIKIVRNGEIKDAWFEKKSGNTYFDESAYKAVMKSNPLPMLPKGYLRQYYNLGLVFTPSGLR